MKLFRLDQLHQEWEEKQDDWRCDAQHREAERQKSTRRRNTAIEFQDHHLKQVQNIGDHALESNDLMIKIVTLDQLSCCSISRRARIRYCM